MGVTIGFADFTMLDNHKQFVAWRRQVFVRNPHRGLNTLYAAALGNLVKQVLDIASKNLHEIEDQVCLEAQAQAVAGWRSSG